MRKAVVAGLGIALLLGFAGYSEYGPRVVPAGQPPLVRIEPGNFDVLRIRFNEAPETVRVLALLSPT
jgi:hypothetical protein